MLLKSRFRPRVESLEVCEVPAAGSFRLSDGTIGSLQFDTPDGVDPAQSSQHIAISDLTVVKGGQTYTVTGTPTADYAYGALVGVTATATGANDTITITDGTATVVPFPGLEDGATATVVYDAAKTQATFTLDDGTVGAMSYDIPWDSVDPTQSSQSLALSNFTLNIAGRNLTEANANFTTLPTVQFAYGTLTGITFAIDTSALTNFPYTSISMSGLTVSAQPPPQGLPPIVPPPHVGQANVRATIILDFSTAATGQAYRIDLVVKDANGNVLMSGPISIGAGATTTDIRDLIAAAVGDSGLTVVATGNNKLRLESKGNTKLGLITYDTFLANGDPAPTLAGPKVIGKAGTAGLRVNGN